MSDKNTCDVCGSRMIQNEARLVGYPTSPYCDACNEWIDIEDESRRLLRHAIHGIRDYAVEVVEKYELRRTYYVEAKNKTEARKMAKNMEWDDAYDGWESDCDGDFGKWSENQLPELMSASVKGEVREEVK